MLKRYFFPIKLKITQVTLSMGTGGIEHCICNLASCLDKNKFDLTVGCLDYGGELLDSILKMGIPTFVMKRMPGLDFRLILKLAEHFRKHAFHIVHTHNQAAHFYGGIAAKLAGVPIILTTEHSRHNIELSKRRVMEKKFLYSLTDKWILVSDALYNHSLVKDRLKPDKLKVVVNGINIDNYIGDKTDNFFVAEKKRDELGLPQDSKIIIMVARLHPIKNHSLLLESCSLIKDRLNNVHILFAGNGECYEKLKNQAVQLGIDHKTHFLGDRQDIHELLWISDLFVLCSRSEGLPLSLLEAAAAKVPVVITESANKASFIVDKHNGTVVDSTKEALSEAIFNILAKPDDYQKMASNGFEIVKKSYSIDSMAEQYEQIYNELAMKKKIQNRINQCVE